MEVSTNGTTLVETANVPGIPPQVLFQWRQHDSEGIVFMLLLDSLQHLNQALRACCNNTDQFSRRGFIGNNLLQGYLSDEKNTRENIRTSLISNI
jgi:hypothetical protein